MSDTTNSLISVGLCKYPTKQKTRAGRLLWGLAKLGNCFCKWKLSWLCIIWLGILLDVRQIL
jgi:hypothetical protein